MNHLGLHSLRPKFATYLIPGGADAKSVQELMGHKILAMTMNLYAKIHSENNSHALLRLSYGAKVTAPDHVVEFPSATPSHNMDTVAKIGVAAGG